MYKTLMGCSLFSNSHFQMGRTTMGLQSNLGSISFERCNSYLYVARSPRLWNDLQGALWDLKLPLFYFINRHMGSFFCPQLCTNQGRRNVFKDTEDKSSFVLNLVGTTFKNRTFPRLCLKIQLGHVPMSPYVPAPLYNIFKKYSCNNYVLIFSLN